MSLTDCAGRLLPHGEDCQMWLIAGLGNPGSKYDNTPHNLGFETVDFLASRHGLAWQDARKFTCFAAAGSYEGDKLFLVKPMTYMNLSGNAVQSFAAYYKIAPQNIIVVCDDVALPWGKIRLRERGSHGGHNGLRDVQAKLASDEYMRLRIGCEPRTRRGDLAAYVLGKMTKAEREVADLAIAASADCIETVLQDGAPKAMSRWNGWSAVEE